MEEDIKKIFLLSIDDWRYDCLSYSDSKQWLEQYDAASILNTPNIDEIAESSIFFNNATSTSSYTPPSHASMFTGQYPKDHGAKTFFNTLDDRNTTLAEFLSKKGFKTYAWIEHMTLDTLGITKGFDKVVCPFEEKNENLFDFLREIKSKKGKVFSFIHLFDIHKPYMYTPGGTERFDYNEEYPDCWIDILPDFCDVKRLAEEAEDEAKSDIDNYSRLSRSLREYADYRGLDYLIREKLEDEIGKKKFEYLVQLYVRGVNKFDRGKFKDLIQFLKKNLLEDYLLIITSDHGEAICKWRDREDFMNSFNVSEGAVRVPLILDTDLKPFQNSSEDPVSAVNHIDIFPTIQYLLGEKSQNFEFKGPGESFISTLRDGSERRIFHESWFYEGGADFFGQIKKTGEGGLSEVAVRKGGYKMTRSFSDTGNPDKALYNLKKDPFEERNIYEKSELVKDLESKLEEYLEGIELKCRPDIDKSNEEAIKERLKALGYLD